MQGVYIYCAKKVREIAEILGDTEKAAELAKEEKAKTEAAKKYLLDSEAGLFVSGPDRQINYASQVWMVLAGAVDKEDGAQILEKVTEHEAGKRYGFPVYESSLCRSTSSLREKRAGS